MKLSYDFNNFYRVHLFYLFSIVIYLEVMIIKIPQR